MLITPSYTSVIAEKVRVLSAERSTVPIKSEDSPQIPSTVTVLVTQEQCLGINMAIPLGKIAFALRNSDDNKPWSDSILSADKLRVSPKSNREDGKISGFISVKGESKQFALKDGVWVRADSLPTNFSVTLGD